MAFKIPFIVVLAFLFLFAFAVSQFREVAQLAHVDNITELWMYYKKNEPKIQNCFHNAKLSDEVKRITNAAMDIPSTYTSDFDKKRFVVLMGYAEKTRDSFTLGSRTYIDRDFNFTILNATENIEYLKRFVKNIFDFLEKIKNHMEVVQPAWNIWMRYIDKQNGPWVPGSLIDKFNQLIYQRSELTLLGNVFIVASGFIMTFYGKLPNSDSWKYFCFHAVEDHKLRYDEFVLKFSRLKGAASAFNNDITKLTRG